MFKFMRDRTGIVPSCQQKGQLHAAENTIPHSCFKKSIMFRGTGLVDKQLAAGVTVIKLTLCLLANFSGVCIKSYGNFKLVSKALPFKKYVCCQATSQRANFTNFM